VADSAAADACKDQREPIMTPKSSDHNLFSRQKILDKYKEYQDKFKRWFEFIWKTPPDDDFEKHEDYKAALEYYKSFEHKDGIDYSVAIAYARERYDRLDKTDKTLDEKADSIIKYLGGGSALITFGALISVKADSWQISLLGLVALCSLMPSLFRAIRAVAYAIQGRRPRGSALTPDVKFAVEIAEHYKTKPEIELNLWLIFHPICEALIYRNMQKAKLVDSAHKWYKLAIGWLFGPVVGIVACLIVALAVAMVQPPMKTDIQGPPPTVQKP
jgi:hypothetical protein